METMKNIYIYFWIKGIVRRLCHSGLGVLLNTWAVSSVIFSLGLITA
jgi:hypothetical protein